MWKDAGFRHFRSTESFGIMLFLLNGNIWKVNKNNILSRVGGSHNFHNTKFPFLSSEINKLIPKDEGNLH